MVHYTGKVILPYARTRVWGLLSDWTNLAAWDVNITRSERVGSAADGAGAKFSCTFVLNGRSSEVDYVCRSWEPEDACVFEGVASLAPFVGVRSQDSLSFREVEGGTEVEATFDLKFAGVLRAFSFVMGGAMASTGPKVMKDIEAFAREKLE